jgi:hypothetical protein
LPKFAKPQASFGESTRRQAAEDILVESSDPKVIVSFVSKYNFWNDVKVVPVIEVGEAVPVTATSLSWAQSASKN